MDTNSLRYAGFGPRLASLLLDLIILLPLMVLVLWGNSQYRLFDLYYFLPGTFFGLFYSVYLVRRFGGTPGKLIVGIRIHKVNGDPVGYREALLRYSPDFIFGMLTSIALLLPLIRMTEAEYHSLAFMERLKRIVELAPPWYKPLQWVQNAWVWGELLVLLTNRKRRAVHDFIAGTVVIHALPKTTPSPTVSDPAVST